MNPATIVCRSIELGDHAITLSAKNLHKYICEWHLDSFVKAIFLGTPIKAIKTIARKMGLVESDVNAESIIKNIDQTMVKAVPPLEIFTTDCNVAITDCVINNVSGSQQFGIGLQIQENNRIGPVTIDGVALQVTLTPQTRK
jgi:hypothetical protein